MTNESKIPVTPDHQPEESIVPTQVDTSDREYEKSGLYPQGEKPFRLFALLAWLAGIVVFIAVSAAALDRILI